MLATAQTPNTPNTPNTPSAQPAAIMKLHTVQTSHIHPIQQHTTTHNTPKVNKSHKAEHTHIKKKHIAEGQASVAAAAVRHFPTQPLTLSAQQVCAWSSGFWTLPGLQWLGSASGA